MSRLLAIGNNLNGNFGVEHSSTVVKNTNLNGTGENFSADWSNSGLTADSGFGFYIGNAGLTYDKERIWTLKLYENDIVVREETIKPAYINNSTDGMYIHKWSTPYSFTGNYTCKYSIQTYLPVDKIMQDNADSSKFAYIGFDNADVAFADGDTLFIPGGVTCELIGTHIIGQNDTNKNDSCNWDSAINICGILEWDENTTSLTKVRGTIALECGGQLGGATLHNIKHRIEFDYSTGGVSEDFGIFTRGMGKLRPTAEEILYKTYYSSGDGSTANPFKVSEDINLEIDDHIVCTGVDEFGETEYKYIISGDFANGYILSDTKGGTESAFANNHNSTGLRQSRVIKINRYIEFDTSDISKGWFTYDNLSENINPWTGVYVRGWGNIKIKSIQFVNCSIFELTDDTYGIIMLSKKPITHRDNLFCKTLNQVGALDFFIYVRNASEQQIKDSLFIDIQVNVMSLDGNSNGCTNCEFIECNTDAESSGGVFRNAGVGSKNYINGCYFDLCQRQIFRIRSNIFNLSIDNNIFCDNVETPSLLNCDGDAYNWDILIKNSDINTTSLGLNLQSGLGNSMIKFHYNSMLGYISNEECITYATQGIYQKCGKDINGTDLDDNIHRTAGNHSFALKPNGQLTWEFKTLARVNDGVLMSGYFKTANFVDGDLLRFELYLPGSTIPDSIEEHTNDFDFDWKNIFVASYYTGILPQDAIVKVVARSTQENAAVYVSDLLNGENDITGLNVWSDAFPSEHMYTTSISPVEVWGMLGSVPVPDKSYGWMMTHKMFDDGIFYDNVNGVSGTAWSVGTEFNPVNNLTDALTIMTRESKSQLILKSSIVLDQDISNIRVSSGNGFTFNCNGYKITGVRISHLGVTGVLATGSYVTLDTCKIYNGLTNMRGAILDTFFVDTTPIVLAGKTTIDNCRSGVAGNNSPVFDFSNGDIDLSVRAYSGGIKIINSTNVNNISTFEFIAGKFNFDSSNSKGVFVVRGNADIDLLGDAEVNTSGVSATMDIVEDSMEII